MGVSDEACLHCVVMALLRARFVATGEVNPTEIVAKLTEVIAEIISTAPAAQIRQAYIDAVARELPGIVALKLAEGATRHVANEGVRRADDDAS